MAEDLSGFALTAYHDIAYRKLVQDSGISFHNPVTGLSCYDRDSFLNVSVWMGKKIMARHKKSERRREIDRRRRRRKKRLKEREKEKSA